MPDYSGQGGLSDIRFRLGEQEARTQMDVTGDQVDAAIDAAMSDVPDFTVIFDNGLA